MNLNSLRSSNFPFILTARTSYKNAIDILIRERGKHAKLPMMLVANKIR